MIRTDTDEFSPAQLRQDALEAKAAFILARADELNDEGTPYVDALAIAEIEWEGAGK